MHNEMEATMTASDLSIVSRKSVRSRGAEYLMLLNLCFDRVQALKAWGAMFLRLEVCCGGLFAGCRHSCP